MNKYQATIISHVFEPLLVLMVVGVVAGFRAMLSPMSLLYYYLFLIVLMMAPVVGFRIWFMKKQGMDWDMSNRKKRILPLFIQIGVVILDVIVIMLWKNPILTNLLVTFLAWLIGFHG